MIASPAGHSQLWVGLIKGPRMNLVTDAIATAGTAARIEEARLIVGLVASDMFYAYDMAAFGSEMRNYLAGRLSRQFDDSVDGPAPASVEIPDDAAELFEPETPAEPGAESDAAAPEAGSSDASGAPEAEAK